MKTIYDAAIWQMNFTNWMRDLSGYDTQTTFYQDFSIADAFGEAAVIDTFDRSFTAWRSNVVYLTELVLVLNHKIWQHHGTNDSLAKVYDQLWKKADQYCMDNLKDDDLMYYLRVTD